MPKQQTDAELASRYGCTTRTLHNWRKAGAPLHSDKLMEKWLDDRRSVPSGTANASPLTKAKLDKLHVEIERAKLELAVRRGEMVSVEAVKRDFSRIGHNVRGALNMIPGEIPNWEGLPAHEMEKKARALVERICAILHDADSYSEPVS